MCKTQMCHLSNRNQLFTYNAPCIGCILFYKLTTHFLVFSLCKSSTQENIYCYNIRSYFQNFLLIFGKCP